LEFASLWRVFHARVRLDITVTLFSVGPIAAGVIPRDAGRSELIAVVADTIGGIALEIEAGEAGEGTTLTRLGACLSWRLAALAEWILRSALGEACAALASRALIATAAAGHGVTQAMALAVAADLVALHQTILVVRAGGKSTDAADTDPGRAGVLVTAVFIALAGTPFTVALSVLAAACDSTRTLVAASAAMVDVELDIGAPSLAARLAAERAAAF
jgi:hypothetical protein